MHTGEKPFQFSNCDTCHIYDLAVYSKSYFVSHDLSVYNKIDSNSHLNSYTNVLLFLCVSDVCLSVFL